MDLRVNYQETMNVGNQIIAKGEEFRNVLARINNINNNLKDAWQGSDASKYSMAVEEQSIYMDKLVNAIDEIGNFLIKVGRAYQEASEANSSAIR